MAYFWTAFNWDDYDRKTSDLPMLWHGSYILLLKHYYRTRKPLPASVKQLLFICRASASEEIAAVEGVLAQFFHLEADGYHHDRCDEEIAKANEISEKRAKAGARGGASKCQANAKQMPVHLQLQQQLQEQVKQPENSDVSILQIAQAYPHSKYRNELEIPHIVVDSILRAIDIEGSTAAVLEHTRRYAASEPAPNFVMAPEKFYSDPNKFRREWTNGNTTKSRFDQLGELLAADAEDERELEQFHPGPRPVPRSGQGIPKTI